LSPDVSLDVLPDIISGTFVLLVDIGDGSVVNGDDTFIGVGI